MAKANDKELHNDLNALKRQSVDRMRDVVAQENGWLLLSKEIAAHKAILGSLLGAPPVVEDAKDEEEDAALAKIMGGA